jgi:ankyrin repeat protein
MRVFLSYSRADRPTAEAIVATLKQAGHSVFFDQDRIQAAEDFNRIIWGQVRKSDLFLFLISPSSVQPGAYALTELGFAEKKWPNPERRVLPVVISPIDIAQVPVYVSLCHILRPEGNVAAEVRATVNRLDKRHRWVRIGRAAAVVAGLALIGGVGFRGYQEYLHQQPIKAREALAAMNIPFDENTFVLHAYQGDLDVVELFLTAGMDPNATTGGSSIFSDTTTALSLAAAMGNEPLVRLLLEAGANEETVNRAFEAVAAGSDESKDSRLSIARLLLSQKFGVGQPNIDQAFLRAAGSGDVEMFRLLSERISDRAKLISAALLDAANKDRSTGTVEISEFLLVQGADVNTRDDEGWTPLLVAIRRGNAQLARFLVEHGADPDVRCKCRGWRSGGWTPLTMALSRGDDTLIGLLLEFGADVNLATGSPVSPGSNTTPLILASDNTSVDVVRTLLDNGARVNDLNGKEFSALYVAVFRGRAETVSVLLEHGADVHAGPNPLLATVNHDRWAELLPIAKLLLEAGADINKPSKKDSQTVLMRAVQDGSPDMVRFFLAAGARLADQDERGRTAEIFAKRGDNKEIIELLQNAEEKGGHY